MSTPLDQLFVRTRQEGRGALIGYLPAGFPSRRGCVDAIKAMVDGGVDAIEIGFPYSDPVMDGPTIQAAANQSLEQGIGAREVFETLSEVTAMNVPAVVMTYWNPIERFGVNAFAREIDNCGGSGVVTPDLTIEEAETWISATDSAGINRIFVIAPSTSDERLKRVAAQCGGFIYAASLMGVTGTRSTISSAAPELVSRIREASSTPVSVGLGVSTRAQAHEVASYADGVIVGSAFIKVIQENANALSSVKNLAEELALGVRGE